MMRSLEPMREGKSTLAEVVETVLDKGLVINADIAVSVVGVELIGIRIKAALASFATAAKFGLEFPGGTRVDTAAWREALAGKEKCPQCQKEATRDVLLEEGCPWCGWLSAAAMRKRPCLEAAGAYAER